MAQSQSDYASLMREVRDTEGLKLEIRRLNIDLKEARDKLSAIEPEVIQLRQGVMERDAVIEDLRSSSGDRNRNIDDKMKQKDETIARLQAALQAKHRELEELRSKSSGMFRKK